VPTESGALAHIQVPRAEPGSPAAQAVAAYLARLSPNSHRTVLGRLRFVAPILGGPTGAVTWHTLGYRRVAWLRDHLESSGVPRGAINLTLIVLRGVAMAAPDTRSGRRWTQV